MRTLSADDTALFTAVGGRATYVRVDVQDASAAWQDLTTFAGQNMVISATWRDSVDGQGQNGEVVLAREVEQLSLSPLMTASPLNLGFAYPGSYAALLQVKRGVRIYTADVPTDAPAANWRLMFEGKIDTVDWGSGETVTLQASDAQGDLRDLFIETERVYAYAQGGSATKGCRIWTPLMTSVAGELLIPTDANRNDHFYIAQNANGTSVASPEPTWPTGAGATVSDGGGSPQVWKESGSTSSSAGTAVETVIQQIIADNGGGSITLALPGGSPGWLIKWYLQQRQPVWDAIRALVDQIGWDIRYKWDSGTNTFKLTLWTPNRSKVTPDYTFAASDQIEISQLKIDVASIRNAITAVFSASGTLDPSGNPVRVSVSVSDSTSITKYGRRFMEIGEASTSNIDTSSEATTMITNALADLKEPSAEKDVSLFYFPFVELGDLYRFSPDGIYNDTNLDLAVIGYEHTITAEGDATTKLNCRGKPSTSVKRWLAQGAEVNPDDIHQLAVTDHHSIAITASSVVGGTLLTANGTANKRILGQDFEWHVSTSSNFTPDSTTLVQSQGGNQVTVPHLLPAQPYFAKIVPIRRNATKIVRGQPSAAFSFTAGQASSGHIVGGIGLGDYPLNGGFETRLNASGMPDQWNVIFSGGGTFGTNLVVMEDGNGISGGRYLRFVMPIGAEIDCQSAVIPIINEGAEANRYSQLYRVSYWVKNGSSNTAGQMNALLTLLDYTGAQVSNSSVLSCSATTKLGHWQKCEAFVRVDAASGARQAILTLEPSVIGSGTCQIDVDEVRLQWVGTPWFEIGDTTKFTENYESIPGFANSWVNFNTSTDAKAAFRKNNQGLVELKGIIKSGTVPATAFVLPVGFRPPKTMRFACVSNAAFCEVDAAAAGDVQVLNGSNTWVDLSGVRFQTF